MIYYKLSTLSILSIRLDSRTSALAWIHNATRPKPNFAQRVIELSSATSTLPISVLQGSHSVEPAFSSFLLSILKNVCKALIDSAAFLGELDSQVGDGDLGSNMKLAAENVLKELNQIDFVNVASTIHRLALILQQKSGGSSGPLFSVFFLRMAQALQPAYPTELATWAAAFSVCFRNWMICDWYSQHIQQAGIGGIEYLGDSKPGDRTMLDALWPALKYLNFCLSY